MTGGAIQRSLYGKGHFLYSKQQYTVELQWLEQLLGPCKLVRDRGSSSQRGMLTAPGQET